MHEDDYTCYFKLLPVLEFQPEVEIQNFKRSFFLEFFSDSNDIFMSTVSIGHGFLYIDRMLRRSSITYHIFKRFEAGIFL